MPGSMDGSVRPMLEKTSGKKCRRDFGLCYNPEFIALGDVIKGMLEPDFVLIGESDARAGDLLVKIQNAVCKNSPPIERMEFVNAELAKIALNSFVTMKVSFANTIAQAEREGARRECRQDHLCNRTGQADRLGLSEGRNGLRWSLFQS